MNVIEAIKMRKSVRKFKDEVVPKEDILKMLELATEDPSPKHQQNWNFVVLTNREIINKMADIVTKSHERLGEIAKTEKDRKIHMSVIKYYTCFRNAPVVLVYGSEYKMIEYKILKDNEAFLFFIFSFKVCAKLSK
ncbi:MULTISPECIES: nitroreductase family protein [unclassified Romboutsia]|uniref:nitroreductase family protein n=1 Tax=unclassified Romboutsia TaxID=2626894 RepID=UPI000822CB2D|nr:MULTISPECIES: nitroreductase family protein [unclassified Romboutsia]SCI40899.1 F420-0--gamma-glutamyl ligase [uncultured Clostridium sp.]